MLEPLLDNLMIPIRQPDTNLFAKEDHRDEEQANDQVDQGSRHEHVGQAHVVEPDNGSQRNGDTDGVADKGDADESLGDELQRDEHLLACVYTKSGFRTRICHVQEELTSR